MERVGCRIFREGFSLVGLWFQLPKIYSYVSLNLVRGWGDSRSGLDENRDREFQDIFFSPFPPDSNPTILSSFQPRVSLPFGEMELSAGIPCAAMTHICW